MAFQTITSDHLREAASVLTTGGLRVHDLDFLAYAKLLPGVLALPWPEARTDAFRTNK